MYICVLKDIISCLPFSHAYCGFIRRINLPLEHLLKKIFFKNFHIYFFTILANNFATSLCTLVVHGLSHSHSAKESLERNRDAPGPCLKCAVSATKLQCGIFCFPGQLLPLHKRTVGGSNAAVWSDSSPPLATEIQWTVCLLFYNHHRKPTGCQETGLGC